MKKKAKTENGIISDSTAVQKMIAFSSALFSINRRHRQTLTRLALRASGWRHASTLDPAIKILFSFLVNLAAPFANL
jgi:hypothetical protein